MKKIMISVSRIILVLAIIFAILTAVLLPSREQARRLECRGQLREIGLICHAYSDAHNKTYPFMSQTPGCFAFQHGFINPTAPNACSSILACPCDEETWENYPEWTIERYLNRNSYLYLGYALLSETEGLAFTDTCRAQFAAGHTLSGEVPAPEGAGSGGGCVFLPLAEDIATRLPKASSIVTNANIPVVVEKRYHHPRGRVGVLYLDGHVEYVRMGEKWPANEEFLEALEDIEAQYALEEEK